MLIQFSVENYLSIKEKVTLSMLASKDNEHPEYLIDGGDKNYLKSAVIYGANASGKSNVLKAFQFVVTCVLLSHFNQLHMSILREPFKFDQQTPSSPSIFEVIFNINGTRYAYGFSATNKAVIDEYLYYYPKGRQSLIFERKNTNDFHFTVDVEEQTTLKERTSANKLYLSVSSNWSYSKVIPVLEWFASCQVLTANINEDAYGLKSEQLNDENYRNIITSMLRVADFGIQSLQINDYDLLSWNLKGYSHIETVHTVKDVDKESYTYTLSMSEESDGTKSYFKLIGFVKKALDYGLLLVVDEIDVHLHPLLTKHLVSLFNSNEFNPKGAQLIFTSHNTNLLDLDVFRRDQIWFTEKAESTSATDLFSLYDFSVRKDAKVEKGYLIGRYGAIPFIKGGR
jgi:AAA15 family ATPase/GTPase